ncbi:MAG: molecular chaperone HtpG [Clostridia bacterium]|jgi:molecular chaperone HtpG|nr:molecular chaperone HtpG [Clostridia bacterium]
MEKQGNIKISSENMMPIIKKWLYSEKDIFLREIVANASDAITKLKKLNTLGETANEEIYRITVTTDEKAKTLTVEDNGIGMSEEEVETYITQIAFSGAADFVTKYEKAGGDGIIGHFGLGFYSAYMVSDNIEIFTKSYQDGVKGVHWTSDGNNTYTIGDCDKETRGTKIVMHISADEKEFLKETTIRQLLNKYCSFMPYEIFLNPKGKDDQPVNTTCPLYKKQPKNCTEEEYKTFYRETFHDYNEPLFWIHLNMEYPFNLKGILYFPQAKKQVELERGQVKLYCNQVYIADNIKEVIPEFLMLLNGVIDCPEIPLNVSRSFLQNDRQVQKIAKHITKKVADKLLELYKNDKEKYENCWKDLATFVKFGCIKDDEFYQKVKDVIVFKNLSGQFLPITQCLGEEISEEDAKAGKEPKSVYYVSDENKQAQYIKMFKEAGLDALVCDTYIDPHFISYIEYKNPKRVRFLRIDADVAGALKEESGEDKETEEIFKSALEGIHVSIKSEKLKNSAVPAIVNVSEFMRRMSEMNQFYQIGNAPTDMTLIVNTANPAVVALKAASEEERITAARHIYYLALMDYRGLTPEESDAFHEITAKLLEKYLQK